MFVRHSVTDYGTWRKGYDDFDPERPGFGVRGHAVFQAVGDPTDVTVYHDFDNVEAAEAFVGSERLREVMEAAGVTGEPQIWIVEQD
jgi:hypothetical protein